MMDGRLALINRVSDRNWLVNQLVIVVERHKEIKLALILVYLGGPGSVGRVGPDPVGYGKDQLGTIPGVQVLALVNHHARMVVYTLPRTDGGIQVICLVRSIRHNEGIMRKEIAQFEAGLRWLPGKSERHSPQKSEPFQR